MLLLSLFSIVNFLACITISSSQQQQNLDKSNDQNADFTLDVNTQTLGLNVSSCNNFYPYATEAKVFGGTQLCSASICGPGTVFIFMQDCYGMVTMSLIDYATNALLATATPSTFKDCPSLSYSVSTSGCNDFTISLACNSYYTVVGCSGQLNASLGYSFPPSRAPTPVSTIMPSALPTLTPTSSSPSAAPSLAPNQPPTIQPSASPTRPPSTAPSKTPSTAPSVVPTAQPSCNPTIQPSIGPSYVPSIMPTAIPSTFPTQVPSMMPSQRPTQVPSAMPSQMPSTSPSAAPSFNPSMQPSAAPSCQPSQSPSASPSVQPTYIPSALPSGAPSVIPTANPSAVPSCSPSTVPTHAPTFIPTMVPSVTPSAQPTLYPSSQPSSRPSSQPSLQPSGHPSTQPTKQPTNRPSRLPSSQPSNQPSQQPSLQPSGRPSKQPSSIPSLQPQCRPSTQPSKSPSMQPSCQPSSLPSGQPSAQPISFPSRKPSTQPSSKPSRQPTAIPSVQPSRIPTSQPLTSPSRQPSSLPSSQPTSLPSRQPSRQPTFSPTMQPSGHPSSLPSNQPSRQPSGCPSREPSAKPSCIPSAQPSFQPSGQPSRQPSRLPSLQPSTQPSLQPTMIPSRQPSMQPSMQPSATPTRQPSRQPSSMPSSQPSALPSRQPSTIPTGQPSTQPSSIPSSQPSSQPSRQPTLRPSRQPSSQPSRFPSMQPTVQPSLQPSLQPSNQPSSKPSSQPSSRPSHQPSSQPSMQPTRQPSQQPSMRPSCIPTMQPSTQPSHHPSMKPSRQPSSQPTSVPSTQPSRRPSMQPSSHPSTQPSQQPSIQPSRFPSRQPTRQPTSRPSNQPSQQPSRQPSRAPSRQPSAKPSLQPSVQPSRQPSIRPSKQPSVRPTGQPSRQPSSGPSPIPSVQPSMQPTNQPSSTPSAIPSRQPSSSPSTIPTNQPSYQPSSFPTMQPSSSPSSQPISIPSRVPTLQPSSIPSSAPSRIPSVQPSSQPSVQPSQATPYAKYLPRIVYTEISGVGNTSLTIQLTLDKEGLVNFGVFHVSQAKASVTAAAVLSQGLSTRTINMIATKAITGLVPSTDYHLFVVLQSLNGIQSNDEDVRRTEQNFTTRCCRTISAIISAPSVWQSVSSTETLQSWITITVTNAPQTSMLISVSVYNSSGTLMQAVLSPSEFTIAAAISPIVTTPISLSSSLLISFSLSIGEYIARMTNTNADYIVAINDIPFQVVASGQELPAPLISSATFSGDGSSIAVVLDSNSDYGGLPPVGAFACNLLFQFKCSSISQCLWTSSKTLSLNIAASDSCAIPGDSVAFAARSTLRAQCPSTTCSTQGSWAVASSSINSTFTAPVIPQTPTVVLKLPSSIGNCTALTVDLSSSIGNGGRSWSSSNISVIGGSANGIEAAAIKSYLASRSYRVFPPIIVPAILFKAGESYTFVAELCNFLGACGQASATISVQAVNLPTITLLSGNSGSGSILQTTRSKALTIASIMKLNPCSDPSSTVGATYSWLVLDSDTKSVVSFQSLSRNPSVLIIPSYTLVVGGSYDVVATVRFGSLFNNATQSVNIVQGSLSACINGGSTRLLAIGQIVNLDGSCSQDEDTGSLTGLQLMWSCSVLSVPTMNCSSILNYDSFASTADSSVVKVAAQTKTSTIALQLQITLIISESVGSRSSSTSVVVTIVPSGAVDISLVAVSTVSSTGKVNPGDAFGIAAILRPPSGTVTVTGNYSWKVSPSIVTNAILTATSKSFPLLTSQQSYLVIAANSLSADLTYTFTLTAFAGSSRSENSLSVLINSPPKPGLFTIDPSSGLALVDSFNLFSSGWVDTDLPLTYQYSYLAMSGNILVLRSANEVTYVSLLLPPGSIAKDHELECYATIYDSLNAYSTSSAEVQSVPAELSSNQTTALVASFLTQAAASVNNSQVDEITQAITAASSLLNTVNCSLAPNCSLLNRAECSSTPHTCGSCISDAFVGQLGDSNSACLSLADLQNTTSTSGRQLQDLLIAQCPSNCSGHGTCSFYSYRTQEKVAACYQTSLDCYAGCDCEIGYSLSASCSASDTEIELGAEQRSTLISTISSLYTLQNPSQQSLQNSVVSLQEAASNAYQLTSTSIDTLITTANAMSSDASTLATDSTTTNSLGGLLHVFDSISTAAIATSSSSSASRRLLNDSSNSSSSNFELAGNVIAGIQSFATIVTTSLLPGQLAFEGSYSNFKISVTNLSSSSSCESNATLTTPRNSLERALGINSPSINVPLCSNSSNSLGVSTLALSRSFFESLSSTAAEWQSNPLIMSFSSFPSTNASARVEIVLPLIQNFTLLSEEPELVQHSCKASDLSTYEYRCSSGGNVSIACLGIKQTLQVQCPYPQIQPMCNVLAPEIGEMDEDKCWQVAFASDNVTCSCPLLAFLTSSNSNSSYHRRTLTSNNDSIAVIPTGTVSVSYVGILSVVVLSFTTTVLSAQGLNGSVINHGREALITLGTLIAAIVLAMAWSYRTDGIQRKVDHHAPMKKSKHQLQAAAHLSHKDRKSSAVAAAVIGSKHANVKQNALTLAEEALPGILTSKSITDRAKDEIKRHHRWFGVVFHYSENFPRLLRVVSLTTNVIIMLFMQSITYNITKGDDGSCSLLTTETTCLQPSSPYAPGASKCYWTTDTTAGNGGVCAFIEPDNSLKIVLFIAIFSAVVTTPIALAVDWLIQKVLSAPTAFVRDRKSNISAALTVISASSTANANAVVASDSNNNNLGIVRRRVQQPQLVESINNSKRSAARQAIRMSKANELQSLANADFKAIVEGVQLYRTTLAIEQDRKEFDMAWGLNHETGCFEGLDDEGKPKISSDTQSSVLSRLRALIKGKKNQQDNVPHLLKAELELLQKRLKDEQKMVLQLSLHHNNHSKREQSKRLLFLFQSDLLPGVKGQILESKDRRNTGKVKSVSKSAKTIAWFFIFMMNAGMLFYVFLFAVSQTQVRQRAWAQSFAIWLVLEVLFVSSAVVLFMHVFLPSLIMKDVHHIQKKLVGNIKEFYKEIHRKKKLKYAVKGSSDIALVSEESTVFNAAKYLFLSHRVATILVSNEASGRGDNKSSSIAEMILHFTTPWPKQSYQHSVDVSKNYNRKFTALTRSLSLIIFYFLTNFLAVPLTIQDMIVHIVATTSIGYTALLHIQLYEIYPVLIVVPTVLIIALVHFLVQASRAQNRVKRQQLLQELHGGGDENAGGDDDQDADTLTEDALHRRRQHLNRRHSLQQGLRVAQRLEQNIDDSDFSLSLEMSSDSTVSNNFLDLMRLDALSLSSGSNDNEEKESLSDDLRDYSDDEADDEADDDAVELSEGVHTPKTQRKHVISDSARSSSLSGIRLSVPPHNREEDGAYTLTSSSSSSSAASGLTLSDAGIDAVFEAHSQREEGVRTAEEVNVGEEESGFDLSNSSASIAEEEDAYEIASN